ncbi:hypothetical protein [Pseudobacteriovorax antillogorgiicola]|uniref:hypothetical protein n=1 Tax=Pseudobacteriovorax antillogorgiicola TaxID=1513793 RepID=UPI00104C4D56|nr:hypothetical protein [Pseudobacteriovorax antillogorgiicola]
MLKDLGEDSEVLKIEKAVAIFQGLPKGRSAESIVLAYHQQRENFVWAESRWFERAFVDRIDQRLKRLVGQWKATAYGSSMELFWEYKG